MEIDAARVYLVQFAKIMACLLHIQLSKQLKGRRDKRYGQGEMSHAVIIFEQGSCKCYALLLMVDKIKRFSRLCGIFFSRLEKLKCVFEMLELYFFAALCEDEVREIQLYAS